MGGKPESVRPLDTRLSASEASRSFSRLLDEVEAGRRFLVYRRGRNLCTMVPAAADGRRVSGCLEVLRARAPVVLDDGFGVDLLAVLGEEPTEEPTEERPQSGS